MAALKRQYVPKEEYLALSDSTAACLFHAASVCLSVCLPTSMHFAYYSCSYIAVTYIVFQYARGCICMYVCMYVCMYEEDTLETENLVWCGQQIPCTGTEARRGAGTSAEARGGEYYLNSSVFRCRLGPSQAGGQGLVSFSLSKLGAQAFI